jgi:hypothetical protein
VFLDKSCPVYLDCSCPVCLDRSCPVNYVDMLAVVGRVETAIKVDASFRQHQQVTFALLHFVTVVVRMVHVKEITTDPLTTVILQEVEMAIEVY